MKGCCSGGGASQCGDEDGGGEEDADSQLFGKAAGGVAGLGADVDEEHPGSEQRGKKNVEMERTGIEVVKKSGERDGGKKKGGNEGGAIAMVEAVTGFEVRGREVGFEEGPVQQACVEQTISGVDHPDGQEHGGWLGPGKMQVAAAGDEHCPQGGYGGSVEREEVPERESRVTRGRRWNKLGA
jgi:hypothetical protein